MASEAEEAEGAAATAPVGPEAARLELVVREVDGPGGLVEHDLEVTGAPPDCSAPPRPLVPPRWRWHGPGVGHGPLAVFVIDGGVNHGN